MREVTAKTPGSCGELVQGKIAQQDFLITCPIDIYSYVTVTLTDEPEIEGPLQCAKINLVLNEARQYLGYSGGIRFACKSEIPRGKGMASSSADLISALAAFSIAVERPLSLEEIGLLCAKVEPTDGLMYPGYVCFDHIKGGLLERLPSLPGLDLLVLDLGGELDTQVFNGSPILQQENYQKEPIVQRAKTLVASGLSHNDVTLIGSGVTMSTLAHEHILPKPNLTTILEAFKPFAHGVINSHSGTVLGIIAKEVDLCLKVARELQRKGLIATYYPHKTVDTGIEIKSERSTTIWQKYPTFTEVTCSKLHGKLE